MTLRQVLALLLCDDALCHTQIPDPLFNFSMRNYLPSLWLTKREYLGATVQDSHAKPLTRVSEGQSPYVQRMNTVIRHLYF